MLVGLITIIIAMVSCSGNKKESNATGNSPGVSIAALKAELEAGRLQPREEPFVVRDYDPYWNEKWIGDAVAYGCYRSGQAPGQTGPSDDELLEDLQIIAKHWHLIRLYGADEDTRRIIRIIDEYELPIKAVLGVWLEPEENDAEKKAGNITQVLTGIELANEYPNIVNALSAGNETQVFWSGHRMKPENVIRYIRALRKSVSIPVTTADDYLYWDKLESREIAREIDFVFTHIHPLWNGKQLEQSTEWLDTVYQRVQQVHPDRMIVIGETGWATAYDAGQTGDGEQGSLIKGEVGLNAQAEFLIRNKQWIETHKIVSFLFEAFDEPWKGGGENSPPEDVEKNWGVFNEDRSPKKSFRTYLEYLEKDQE